MSFTAQRTAGSDLLTRTALRLDESDSSPAVAQVMRALQRVPGVLSAQLDPVSSQAIVAHDPAVPLASLLIAVEGTGLHAEIIDDGRAPAMRAGLGLRLAPRQLRYLMIGMTALLVIFVFVNLLVPESTLKHSLMVALTTSFWLFFFAQMFAGISARALPKR